MSDDKELDARSNKFGIDTNQGDYALAKSFDPSVKSQKEQTEDAEQAVQVAGAAAVARGKARQAANPGADEAEEAQDTANHRAAIAKANQVQAVGSTAPGSNGYSEDTGDMGSALKAQPTNLQLGHTPQQWPAD